MAKLGTRSLKLMVNAVERNADVSTVEVLAQPADSDFVTYADAASGGARKYVLHFIAAQDMDTATLWRLVWASAGTTVAVKVNPYGVTTATTSTPFYTGNVTITEPDGPIIGGEANSSTTARQTFECNWEWTAKPTEVTTGTW